MQTQKANDDRLPAQTLKDKEPARQIPVESIEDTDAPPKIEHNLEEPSSDFPEPETGIDAASEQLGGTDTETADEDSDPEPKAEGGVTAGADKPEKEKSASGAAPAPSSRREPPQSGASFSDDAGMPDVTSGDTEQAARGPAAFPGLPRRKPRKPVIRKSERDRKSRRPDPALKRTDRDKYLCKALQACRNDFIRCKSKIKHPDQSPEWSAEKEACGAIYKDCVHKDFQGGEWFFTRWFYFQELNCK